MLDKFIIEFDKSLRTLLAPARSARPLPDKDLNEAEVSEITRMDTLRSQFLDSEQNTEQPKPSILDRIVADSLTDASEIKFEKKIKLSKIK